jgi:hypothetical protein
MATYVQKLHVTDDDTASTKMETEKNMYVS